ncbi:MAG: aldo/keto reductase [Clostridia bacterium]|nr:aldo/keto reductase [Clostridia bacterium]
MIFNHFKDKKLSALGMGTMRLPVMDSDNSKIDTEQTAVMVKYALEHGINYFDTAWGYHNGNSEPVIGKILSQYPRESFYLATKFPGYDLANIDKVEEIFEKQLERLKTEYFDFYLIHNVCELNIDQYLDPAHRIYSYLTEQKENGRIRHLGFSIHGDMDVMEKFLEVYGDKMEFCQIQLNWLDYHFQGAYKKLRRLKELNIPVWVMEPLRGGMLAKLSAEHTEQLKALRPEETIPAWAFRYIQSFPEVAVTLSGMSDFTQLKQNIATFETHNPLNESERKTLYSIAENMTSKCVLPCTSCRYCTDHCPMELDIPKLLGLYNEHTFTGGGFLAPMALEAIPSSKHPSACIGCKSCESVCPQQIKISDALADFTKKLK